MTLSTGGGGDAYVSADVVEDLDDLRGRGAGATPGEFKNRSQYTLLTLQYTSQH